MQKGKIIQKKMLLLSFTANKIIEVNMVIPKGKKENRNT